MRSKGLIFFTFAVAVFAVLEAEQTSAQDQIHLAQCQGDSSLPIVAQRVERDRGIKVTWDTLGSSEVKAKLEAGLASGNSFYDGIWACPLEPLQELFDSGAFMPASSYTANRPPGEFYRPDQAWYPVTLDVGVVCVGSRMSNDVVRAAIETDPSVLLNTSFQGRVGFYDPVRSDTGYNWLASFAQSLGTGGLERFAQDFAEQAKPVFEAGCDQVVDNEIDVAFSTWFDAFDVADNLDIVVPGNTWGIPYVFALLASSDVPDAASALIDAVRQDAVQQEVGKLGEVVMPPSDLSISLQTKSRSFNTRIRPAPSSLPD